MLRLVVTASGTGPTEARIATYIEKSVSPIMVGPEIVPPGRRDFSLNARRTRQPPCQAASIVVSEPAKYICGNSRASSCATCSADNTAGRLPVLASMSARPRDGHGYGRKDRRDQSLPN